MERRFFNEPNAIGAYPYIFTNKFRLGSLPN